VITSELSGCARFAELASWPQHERDLAAETIYRIELAFSHRPDPGPPHPSSAGPRVPGKYATLAPGRPGAAFPAGVTGFPSSSAR
jgi:hypothetical protein